MWLDPLGLFKGAMAAKDLVTFDRYEGGGEHRRNPHLRIGKFRIQGSLEPGTNRVVRIQAFVPHPLLGDMVEEKTYADYKQFGERVFARFPPRTTNWDHELRPQGFFGVPDGGHNSFQITNVAVQPTRVARRSPFPRRCGRRPPNRSR